MRIVSRDHPLVLHFQKDVVPNIGTDFCVNPTKNTVIFHGMKNLFDSRWITQCTCEILPCHLTESPITTERWETMGEFVKSRWICAIKRLDDLQILEEDYLAVDNEIHLQSKIGAIIRWNTQTITVNFHYLPSNELSRVAETCAKKSDVYEIISGIFLINADGGLIIYEDGHRSEIFFVSRSQKLYRAIERKCRWMRDYLLLGTIPHCRHLKRSQK